MRNEKEREYIDKIINQTLKNPLKMNTEGKKQFCFELIEQLDDEELDEEIDRLRKYLC